MQMSSHADESIQVVHSPTMRLRAQKSAFIKGCDLPDDAKTRLSGYLEKRARGRPTRYQMRYFVLCDRYLRYHKTQEAKAESDPVGKLECAAIDLRMVVRCGAGPDVHPNVCASAEQHAHDNAAPIPKASSAEIWLMMDMGDVVWLRAESPALAKKWVDEIAVQVAHQRQRARWGSGQNLGDQVCTVEYTQEAGRTIDGDVIADAQAEKDDHGADADISMTNENQNRQAAALILTRFVRYASIHRRLNNLGMGAGATTATLAYVAVTKKHYAKADARDARRARFIKRKDGKAGGLRASAYDGKTKRGPLGKADQERAQVTLLFEGFAKKKTGSSKRRAFRGLAWVSRYFVAEGHYLKYFSDASRKTFKGAIDLNALQSVTRGVRRSVDSHAVDTADLELHLHFAAGSKNEEDAKEHTTGGHPESEGESVLATAVDHLELVLRVATSSTRARWCAALLNFVDPAYQSKAEQVLQERENHCQAGRGASRGSFDVTVVRKPTEVLGLSLDHGKEVTLATPVLVQEILRDGAVARTVRTGGEIICEGDELTHIDGVPLLGMVWEHVLQMLACESVILTFMGQCCDQSDTKSDYPMVIECEQERKQDAVLKSASRQQAHSRISTSTAQSGARASTEKQTSPQTQPLVSAMDLAIEAAEAEATAAEGALKLANDEVTKAVDAASHANTRVAIARHRATVAREALSAAVAAEDYRQAAKCKRQLAEAQKEQRDCEEDASRKSSVRCAAEDVQLAAQKRSHKAAEDLGTIITRAAEVALERQREGSKRARKPQEDTSSELKQINDVNSAHVEDDGHNRGNDLEQDPRVETELHDAGLVQDNGHTTSPRLSKEADESCSTHEHRFDLLLDRSVGTDGSAGLILDHAPMEPIYIEEVVADGAAARCAAAMSERLYKGDELTHADGVLLKGLPWDRVLEMLAPERVTLRIAHSINVTNNKIDSIAAKTVMSDASVDASANVAASRHEHRREQPGNAQQHSSISECDMQMQKDLIWARAEVEHLRRELVAVRARAESAEASLRTERAAATVAADERDVARREVGRIRLQALEDVRRVQESVAQQITDAVQQARDDCAAEIAHAQQASRAAIDAKDDLLMRSIVRRMLAMLVNKPLVTCWRAWAEKTRECRHMSRAQDAVAQAEATGAAAERTHARVAARRRAARRCALQLLHRQVAAAFRGWRTAAASRRAALKAVARHWRRQRPRALRRAFTHWTASAKFAKVSELAAMQVSGAKKAISEVRGDARRAQGELLNQLEHLQTSRRGLVERLEMQRQEADAAQRVRHEEGRRSRHGLERHHATLQSLTHTLQLESKRRVAAEAALRAVASGEGSVEVALRALQTIQPTTGLVGTVKDHTHGAAVGPDAHPPGPSFNNAAYTEPVPCLAATHVTRMRGTGNTLDRGQDGSTNDTRAINASCALETSSGVISGPAVACNNSICSDVMDHSPDQMVLAKAAADEQLRLMRSERQQQPRRLSGFV